MKRILSLLLTFAMTAGLLSACGEGRGVSTPAPASSRPIFTPDPAAVPVTPAGPSSEAPAGGGLERVPFDQPGEDDMSLYDTAAIRDAWAAGSSDGLSNHDRAIYGVAKAVLDKTIQDGMSDYEKEEALYNWVVSNVNYDWTHQDVMTETPRESYTPYGGLVERKAVCLGYATTFQLLMDLAGVECITVVGASSSSSSDHAWNMVKLEGEWYCVDPTWDASYHGYLQGEELMASTHRYFNVTSDYMRQTDHQWDYDNVPEATATRFRWDGTGELPR